MHIKSTIIYIENYYISIENDVSHTHACKSKKLFPIFIKL